jgi:hypothetical protein
LKHHPKVPAVLSLDTLAYGGLIPSRMNTEPLSVLEGRVADFMAQLQPGHRPRYAFSSVLRIPNYNYAEEEPDYWQKYGQLLYQFSAETHQQGEMPASLFGKIPGPVLNDFLSRREKNFTLNQYFLALVQNHTLDLLTYCQDDTGPYGLNVQEARKLGRLIDKQNLGSNAFVQTGADELAVTLMARWLWQQEPSPLKVYTAWFPDHGKKVMALFDGIPLGNVVDRQLRTIGAIPCLKPTDADLVLCINAPSQEMGDHCSPRPVLRDPEHVQQLVNALRQVLPAGKAVLADIAYANGADPVLMKACMDTGLLLGEMMGYAAWNTPGNTIGSALAMGAMGVWARRHQCLNDSARHRLLFIRLLDDWVYQAEVRANLRSLSSDGPSATLLHQEMQTYLPLVTALTGLSYPETRFSFPCGRFFEVKIDV